MGTSKKEQEKALSWMEKRMKLQGKNSIRVNKNI